MTGFSFVADLAVKAAGNAAGTLSLAAVRETAIAVAVELAQAVGPLMS